MKKSVSILFLMLAGTMYWGLIISYIGCRFLPSSAAASFCSCEQEIISSLYQQEGDHPMHEGMISKVHGSFSIIFFRQHSMPFLPELFISNLSKPSLFRQFPQELQGFIGSLFRPPARKG